MIGVLTKLSDNKNNLRTLYVKGEFFNYPTLNSPFTIISDPLNTRYDYRNVTTSIIVSFDLQEVNTYVFNTLNSKYKLEVM